MSVEISTRSEPCAGQRLSMNTLPSSVITLASTFT
jgi:hypothetical protein